MAMMDKKRWLAGLLTVMLTFNTCVGSVQADFGDGTEAVTETVQEESTENVNEDSSDLEEEEASAETA